MTVIRAKGLNGHGLNEFQPINGVSNIVPYQPSYFESSIGYDASLSSVKGVEYFESSVGFTAVVLNDDSPLGEIICAPNPITTTVCTAV